MDLAELEFDGTLWELIHNGRKAPLVAYVRSDKPLGPTDRQHLADLLEGKLKRKRGRPRGGVETQRIRFLAAFVRDLKAELRQQGQRYGIHDKAIDRVLDTFSNAEQRPSDREKLENYLRRSRRKSRKN